MIRMLILIGILSAGNLFGMQVEPAIRDLTQIALAQNIQIQISLKQKRIVDQTNPWSQAGFFPTIDLSGQLSDSRRNVKTTFQSGSTVEKNPSKSKSTHLQLSGKLWLFRGGDGWHQLTLQEQKVAQQHLKTRQIIEDVFMRMIRDYYEWLRLHEWLAISKENNEVSNQQLLRIKEKSDWGELTQLDYLKAKVDRDTSRHKLATQEVLIAQIERRLAVALQTNDWAKSEYVENQIIFSTEMKIEELLEQAKHQNVGLLLAHNQYHQSQIEAKQVISSLFPMVLLDVNYQWATSESDSSFILKNKSEGPSMSLIAQMNVFDGFKDVDKLNQVNTGVEIVELQRKEIQVILDQNIHDLFDQYQLKRDKIAIDKQTEEHAKKSYKKAISLYELGQLTYLQLREYRLSCNRVQYEYISNKYQTKQLEWELMRLSGKMIKNIIK